MSLLACDVCTPQQVPSRVGQQFPMNHVLLLIENTLHPGYNSVCNGYISTNISAYSFTRQGWLLSADELNQVLVLPNFRALLTILLFIFDCLFSVTRGLFQTASHLQFLP